jgi:hypothetical protein
MREDLPGGRGLAAYWVAAGEPPPAAEELRRRLAAELPEHLVPAAFTRVAELPLDRHGKVDPRALPAPRQPARAAAGWVPPENELEQALAAIVCEILRLPRVGRDENFFDLGAHSLALVLVHERCRASALGELTVLDLFRHPTIRELARHLGRGTAAPAPETVPAGTVRGATRTAARDQRLERAAQRRSVRGS